MNIYYFIGVLVLWVLVLILVGALLIGLYYLYFDLYAKLKGFKQTNKILTNAIKIAKNKERNNIKNK